MLAFLTIEVVRRAITASSAQCIGSKRARGAGRVRLCRAVPPSPGGAACPVGLLRPAKVVGNASGEHRRK
jgi:hypothetical protein